MSKADATRIGRKCQDCDKRYVRSNNMSRHEFDAHFGQMAARRMMAKYSITMDEAVARMAANAAAHKAL